MKKYLALLPFVLTIAKGQVFSDSVSIARPQANVTAYANGDIVATTDSLGIFHFEKFGAYSSGFITGASLEVDTASTSGGFRLWLFKDTTDFAKIADNAAWVAPAAMMSTLLVGYIDFNLSSSGIGAGAGGNAEAVFNLNIQYSRLTTRGLYGRLTTTGAYTPKAGGRFKVFLHGYGVM